MNGFFSCVSHYKAVNAHMKETGLCRLMGFY